MGKKSIIWFLKTWNKNICAIIFIISSTITGDTGLIFSWSIKRMLDANFLSAMTEAQNNKVGIKRHVSNNTAALLAIASNKKDLP